MTLVIVSIILMNLTIRIGYKKKYGKYLPLPKEVRSPMTAANEGFRLETCPI